MSPGFRSIVIALAATLVLGGPLVAHAGPRGGAMYQGTLPGGGLVSFVVADSGRAVEGGVAFSLLRAPCGGGREVTLYNVELDDRRMPIRNGRVRYRQNRGGQLATLRIDFAGRSARGAVRISMQAGGRTCRTGSVPFVATSPLR